MNYYIIETPDLEEAILAAKDDADADRYCKQSEFVTFVKIHLGNPLILKTDEAWAEYLQELYDTKQRAEDAFNEAAINYENALSEVPEHIREDFE